MSTSSASLWSALTRRKPVDAIEDEPGTQGSEGGLTRSLGLWQLTAIGVGGIIGTGIFTLAGTVANQTAGPAVLISFLIAGIASAAAALLVVAFTGFRRVNADQRLALDVLMEVSCRRGRAGRVEAAGAGDAPSVDPAADPHQVRTGRRPVRGRGATDAAGRARRRGSRATPRRSVRRRPRRRRAP